MLLYAREPDALPLTKAHQFDAGFDIAIPKDIEIAPHALTLAESGIHLKLEPNQTAFVRSRSSTAKLGLMIITGVIDAGYTGEIKVQIFNFTGDKVVLKRGQRIAQIVVVENAQASQPSQELPLEQVTNSQLDNRGEFGFGSSGV